MNRPLRLVVADDEPDIQNYLCKMLPRLGHRVVGVAENGRRLVEQCHAHQPDLIITDVKMPELDGIEAAEQLYRTCEPIPVVLVSAHYDPALISRAESDHIMAYLIKPIKMSDLEPAIDLAALRFHQLRSVRQQAIDLSQALQDRETIHQAQGILMKRESVDEPTAFRQLQQLAQQRNQNLIETASALLTGDQYRDTQR